MPRVLPWTYEAPGGAVEGNPLGVLDNYGKKPVTVAVEEQELRFGDKALVARRGFQLRLRCPSSNAEGM